MAKTELTNMCMIYKDNKVLVQERVKSWKGISFPGGHVEDGESVIWSNNLGTGRRRFHLV